MMIYTYSESDIFTSHQCAIYSLEKVLQKTMYLNMVPPIVTYLPHAPPSYLPNDVAVTAVTAVTDLPHTPAPPSSHPPLPAP